MKRMQELGLHNWYNNWSASWTTEQLWLNYEQGQGIILLYKACRPPLGYTWSFIQWIPLALEVKLQECKDHQSS